MSGPCSQLRALVSQLERGLTNAEDQARLQRQLLELAAQWPEEAPEDEASAMERLTLQLGKLTDGQQQALVAAFRPLREGLRQRLSDAAAAVNRWLAEMQEAEKGSVKGLVEVLQGMDDAYWLRCYKQCPDLSVKASFLLAIASVARAFHGEEAPMRAQVSAQPRALALIVKLVQRLFVIPKHGNVLAVWHEGRMECYNRTLWRAARRAADRLRDDLQVRLVSALRRATSQPAGGKAKPQLQLELRAWPMVGCPLAKSFLDFVAQRGHALGNLGKPALSECPPHSLRPQTLRRLLGRLEAFEVLDSEAGGKTGLGVVRLRWEAVAALAFKAVGTKPKAAAQAATVAAAAGAGLKGSPTPEVPKAGSAALLRSGAVPQQHAAQRSAAAGGDDARGGVAPLKMVQQKIDWSSAPSLLRLVRRGLRAGDDEWRQGWQQFCKQKRLPIELAQGSHSKDAMAEFLERNLSKLLKKDWARDLMYKVEGLGEGPLPESDGEDAQRSGGARKRASSCSRGGSSSASDSSRSKRRRRRRRHEKRKLGAIMGYGDYFGRGQKDLHITPEVMMMNQMMGMSMMMNSPLAMMGMAPPMMSHPMPMMPTAGGMKPKKAEPAAPSREGAAADTKPPAKDGKLDWSKRKEAMIDADDL